jgi:hypothetical protein
MAITLCKAKTELRHQQHIARLRRNTANARGGAGRIPAQRPTGCAVS